MLYVIRTRAIVMRNGECALLPLTKGLQCHCLCRLLGTLLLFLSRTRSTLGIRHFPRFFHEIRVPEANAAWTTENKHGGQKLCEPERGRKNKQNLTDSRHMWGENKNIFHASAKSHKKPFFTSIKCYKAERF